MACKKYANLINKLKSDPSLLKGIKRGVEKESLRLNLDCSLAKDGHHKNLGSALCHPLITTDFANMQLEFITPPTSSIQKTINILEDIHKFTYENIENTVLWPFSMPPSNYDEITLADYGSSNLAKMKTLYRQGLANRYGANMQIISGVHFNFSLSDNFFKTLFQKKEQGLKEAKSQAYFKLIRTFYKFSWIIPFLFGSSPFVHKSFVNNNSKNKFKEHKNYCYLKNATSLRMSDIGYTNKAQKNLYINYNSLDEYLISMRRAVCMSYDPFEKIGIFKNGKYQQLNTNILQIENELYTPIRPKSTPKENQTPSDALEENGVDYIELRALDVMPFADVGITKEQIHFLDIFLIFCILYTDEKLDFENLKQYNLNLEKTVKDGLNENLKLVNNHSSIDLREWLEKIFYYMEPLAKILDINSKDKNYQQSLKLQKDKIYNYSKLPSYKILDKILKSENPCNLLKETSLEHKKKISQKSYKVYKKEDLENIAKESIQMQQKIENNDSLNFADYLKNHTKCP